MSVNELWILGCIPIFIVIYVFAIIAMADSGIEDAQRFVCAFDDQQSYCETLDQPERP